MLQEIEITQLPKPSNRYKTDRTLLIHNTNLAPKNNASLKLEFSQHQEIHKKIVPIKEYSNKFLRESASKENEKEKKDHCRLNLLVNRHKSFQKKYQKMLGKKHYVCKTEPNENEYQCFKTTKHFYKQTDLEGGRIRTESMIEKNHSRVDLDSFDKEEFKYQQSQFLACMEEPEIKIKTRYECLVSGKKDEKISTSRALELFSKIVSKDKHELLDKIRVCNQTKLFKQKLMESFKNLQAKQMVLGEKEKKFSFSEKRQRKLSMKTSIKYRHNKKSEANRMFEDDEDYQIKGWDFLS